MNSMVYLGQQLKFGGISMYPESNHPNLGKTHITELIPEDWFAGVRWKKI
jgi:hypothetical protein